jgi:hypothetical protein
MSVPHPPLTTFWADHIGRVECPRLFSGSGLFCISDVFKTICSECPKID